LDDVESLLSEIDENTYIDHFDEKGNATPYFLSHLGKVKKQNF